MKRLLFLLIFICTNCTAYNQIAPIDIDMPLTKEQLIKLCPNAKPGWIDALFRINLSDYGINTPRRYNYFMSQILQETDGLREITEAGSKAYFSRYEGRKDLGNTIPGDGYKYRGRGPTQTTGREVYTRIDKQLKLNGQLIANPDIAVEDPELGWKVALIDWNNLHLNQVADTDNIRAVTKRLNGGYNGLQERIQWYGKVKKLNQSE